MREAEAEEFIDEEGAIVFEGVAAELREARLPADVPIRSREAVRQHRCGSLSLQTLVRALCSERGQCSESSCKVGADR